ncbi:MAG: alpha/beta hydrolase [Deltaproteobacteria bacterium]|nr:alpha/beta hydrolase [Deltaproteobacteria bacterium]
MAQTKLAHCSDRNVVVDTAHGGVRLHYVEAAPPSPDATPLVLVPGQSMPWDSYQKVIPRLRQRYHVFALDVRGHGTSQHTPGEYSFGRCADDLIELLRTVVRRPALLTGNSSGGIIGMIAAARAPELVRGLLMEDPPLFSTDWPRLRDDTWVHGFFVHTVNTLPDLATYFATLRIPTKGRVKLMSFPRPLAWFLGGAIRRRQAKRPGAPVDIPWLPLHVRLFVRGLSEYDVDFTRACVDGRMCDVDQGSVLAQVRCPATLMTAHSFRHPELGLVGAMDDDDVARARQIQPAMEVQRLQKPHVIHLADPRAFCGAIDALAERC